MTQYETNIGLEIHVELATKTKIFCGCSTGFGAKVNTHICPVCTGLPGALPVLNRKVAELAIAVGLAVNADIARNLRFDRKNYFYPDNPQNYQISQLYTPVCTNGLLNIATASGEKNIRIRELHMEEDAGKLIHQEDGTSLVDYNRSGVPLIEIVTEPDFETADEVVAFLEKLRRIIQYLKASDCRMQEGSLRVDVNLSVRERGSKTLGTRTEMKNLNSFRSVARAIQAEAERQIAVLSVGNEVVQESRRWEDTGNESVAMRLKETTADYRYFPDPDLPVLEVSEEWIEEIKAKQPEFPEAKAERYQKEFALPKYDAEILTSAWQLAELFEQTAARGCRPKEVSNWLMTELLRLMRENGEDVQTLSMKAEDLAELIGLVKEGKINRTVAKQVFEAMYLYRVKPLAYVTEQGLLMTENEEELGELVQQVFVQFPQSVADYRGGKEKAFGFLIGQTMKAAGGRANPETVAKVLRKCLQFD